MTTKSKKHAERLEYCLRQENTLNGAFSSGKNGEVIEQRHRYLQYNTENPALSQHKWSGGPFMIVKMVGGTTYVVIVGPAGPLMHRHKWSG